jgi:hypothetical protein
MAIRRRTVVLALVGLAAVAVAVAIVSPWMEPLPANERPEIEAALTAAGERVGPDGVFPAMEVAPFAWQRMHVFEAYTSSDIVNESLGFEWSSDLPLIDATWVDVALAYDARSLILFVDGERDVTGWLVTGADVPGAYVRTGASGTVHPRETAYFRVSDDGYLVPGH